MSKAINNEEAAYLIAKKVCNPGHTEFDIALQIFIEKLCVPRHITSYTEERLKIEILKYLNYGDKIANLNNFK